MTQVAESVDAVWSSDHRHHGFDEDLELHQNAKSLVEEITDALRSSRNIFNDRGTIESALRDALESCSYQEEGLIQISYRESQRRNRRQTVEYVYLSTFPVHWDELELDQEINSIEEEIARIEEQKLLLKRSSSFCSSDLSGSESNSDVGSLSQSSSSAEQSEDEDRFLPPLASATKRITLNKVDLRQNAKRRKITEQEDKKQKNKKIQKKTVSCATISHATLKIKQEESTSRSIGSPINSIDSNCSSPSSSPAKKPVSLLPSLETRKQHTEQIFRIEQVLKLKSVDASDGNEDEDIDILN